MAKEKDKEKEAAPEKDEEGKVSILKDKKKLLIFGGIGAAVLIGIITGAILFLSGSGSKQGGATPPSEEKPATAEEKKEEGTKEKKGEGKEKKGKGEKNSEEKKEGESKPSSSEDQSGFGTTFPLQPFHLNLGNPLENHYVRLEISLEYKGGDAQQEEMKKRVPLIRDAVINVTSKHSREFLLGPDGKDQLRLELLTRINQYLPKKIENVYITDIIIE